MRTPVYTTQFKRDFKRCQKRNYDISKIVAVMSDIEKEIALAPQLKEHPLQGEFAGCLECHLETDWLLVYDIDDSAKEVYFVRTGTHSDIFE
jgi:mRNA interferase YafQ